ncbi:toxin VasX [Pseudomonas sp. FSL R10-1350]|uniref:toxin VasX n=1 Tax=Pseudomonas sp. FSL R10-1350 TaxID=2662197 RepID=UPI00211441A4|nr:toxin VasX [Pseudomonas sp. FSL R10-1350]
MSKPFWPKNPNNVNLSRDDARNSMGTCPLMKTTVQLIPLRYAIVDNPGLDPASEVAMPYSLDARPLGIRLLRDGWLYVIEGSSGTLSEYRIEDGLVSAMLWQGREVFEDDREAPIHEPRLIYAKTSTLYVTYSEVPWTAKKCQQVLSSTSERNHFMQAVDLSKAKCDTGGPHLLTPDMTEHWLAEVATERIEAEQQNPATTLAEHTSSTQQRLDAELPEHERLPYLWETPARFSQTSMNRLTGCIHPQYRHDTLYLVLEDTLGVMRDLANYQDHVVGWIDDWSNGGAKPGHNERDYVLACYIESLSQLNARDVKTLIGESTDPAHKALLDDLLCMAQPQYGVTDAAIIEYLERGGLMTPPAGSPVPAELEVLRQRAQALAENIDYSRGMSNSADALNVLEDVDRRFFTREHFRVAPPAFVDEHFEALIALGKQQSQQITGVLYGTKLGQRGVNELIDREAMDRELLAHRAGLARWNHLLDAITADRVKLTCSGAFHKAGWYFDPMDIGHAGHAFATEYACLKDICRSDDACEQLLAYSERNPQFSRPLYYTLPYSDQTTLWVHYAFLLAAGMVLFNNSPELLARLRSIEQSRLPALDDLPDSTRSVANAALNTLTPALNRGLENVLVNFDEFFKNNAMPDVEELLRKLPVALKSRIVQAAKTEGVTFHFATPQEQAALRETLSETFKLRQEIALLKKKRAQSNRQHGHKSQTSRELLEKIQYDSQRLDLEQRRLAASLSPIPELPDEHARIFGSTQGKAGLMVIFPNEGKRQVAGLMDNFRKGVHRAPVMNVLGDGAALLLFVAQAVNLVQVFREVRAKGIDNQDWGAFKSALAATGAVGFAAAQGVFDTALSAQAKNLGEGLVRTSLSRLQVTIGNLHVGLGFLTYAFGFAAAVFSLNTYRDNWVQAVRSGNRGAQNGALITMGASGGLAATNAYGFGHTAKAGYQVLMAAKGEARKTAWKVAGARLGSVFFRSSWAGGFFTILELAGTWLYNRYNTSGHDQWLQSTPWGLDVDKRKDLNLHEFQHYLTLQQQAPFVEVKRSDDESFWQSMLCGTKPGEIFVILPGVTLADYQDRLDGRASHGLKIGAQRITTFLRGDRGIPVEQREVVTEQVQAGLYRMVSKPEKEQSGPAPLLIKLTYPRNSERTIGNISEELLIELELQSLDDEGQLVRCNYRIRFNPLEGGRFLSAKQHFDSNVGMPLLGIDVMAMEPLQ